MNAAVPLWAPAFVSGALPNAGRNDSSAGSRFGSSRPTYFANPQSTTSVSP